MTHVDLQYCILKIVGRKICVSDFDFRYVGKSGGVPKVVQKAWGAEISLIMKEYGSLLGKSTDLS